MILILIFPLISGILLSIGFIKLTVWIDKFWRRTKGARDDVVFPFLFRFALAGAAAVYVAKTLERIPPLYYWQVYGPLYGYLVVAGPIVLASVCCCNLQWRRPVAVCLVLAFAALAIALDRVFLMWTDDIGHDPDWISDVPRFTHFKLELSGLVAFSLIALVTPFRLLFVGW